MLEEANKAKAKQSKIRTVVENCASLTHSQILLA
jgi:hypothetical protein